MELVQAFVFSFAATLLFGVGMYAPRRSLLLGALFGAMGYGVYLWLSPRLGEMGAMFFGTLAVSLSGEIAARVFGFPSIVFIFPGVIPLVPGVGLYQTILTFVEGDTLSALSIGVETVLIAAIMAMTIGVSNVAVRVLAAKIRKRKRPAET